MPGEPEESFRYRLYAADGSELCDAECPRPVRAGDTIDTPNTREFRVTALVPLRAPSKYAGLVMVEAVSTA
jgi:hypothetical protein